MPPAAEAPPHWLRRLWERMAATYGHAWTSTHGITPHEDHGPLTVHGDTWAKALAGIDGQQLAAGLRACIAEGAEFPPSAPRFRAMCLGIPSLARVRLEMLGSPDERSPFTRFTWGLIDIHRYRQSGADQADRILRDAYDLASEERMRGAPLPPDPVAAITDDSRRPHVPASPEVAKAAIDACREMLNPARSPALAQREESLMAEFGCSRSQAQAIVEGGCSEVDHG